MHLWIIRHADAMPLFRHEETRADGDFSRELSMRGRADAERVGSWLRANGHTLDAIVASDARRASDTAAILARALGLATSAVRTEHRLYNASAAAIVQVVRESGRSWRSLAIVGHNPGVSAVVRLLAPDRLVPALPTLGVARLDIDCAWADLDAGCAQVSLYVDPAATG